MTVLRLNRESLLTVLEAFVYDPLVYWKITQTNVALNKKNNITEYVALH